MGRILLLAHGGGPTAVLNASLYGAIEEAKKSRRFSRILAARRGIASPAFIDLTGIGEEELSLLPHTPGSAIGTGRDPIEKDGYALLARRFAEHGITDVLLSGGNGTMETARRLAEACKDEGILVDGIPKTMDNDISGADHTPGYPSAARYLAGSVREVAQDVKGLAIHIVVIEAFGRDSGWIAASSALAREKAGDGPDMILCPEIPFDEDAFLSRAQNLYDQKKGVIVVASESLRYPDGKPIVDPVLQIGRSVYYGDVSAHLSQLISRKLGIKSRNEKPGIFGRASEKWASETDRAEAIACGRASVRALLEGKSGWMSRIRRMESDSYRSEIDLVPIDSAVLQGRTLPPEYLDPANYDVTPAFVAWARPLVGDLGHYISFLD